MADELAHVNKTLEDVKRQIVAKIDEAAHLLAGAHMLEDMLGMPHSTLADYIGETDAAPVSTVPLGNSAAVSRTTNTPGYSRSGNPRAIKPDQFLGQAPLDAAKKYIALVGHAVHLDEIAEAVQRGGAALKGADWRDKLEMSLLKSVYEVVKVQDKTFGLLTFYSAEQIAGLRGTRRSEGPKPKKRATGKKRDKNTKPPKATANAQAKPPKSAKVAVQTESLDEKTVEKDGQTGQVH